MNSFEQRIITACSLLTICLWLYTYAPVFIISGLLCIILGYVLVIEWPRFGQWWLTPFYPIMPFCALIVLNHLSSNQFFILMLITVAGHDTGAYLGGKLWGKHKLVPDISPQKTWEGFFCGFIFSLVVTFIANTYIIYPLSVFRLLLFWFIMNLSGVFGDLFESYLKRRAGIKDSGTILPGHGGILDRCDSIMVSAEILVLLYWFFPGFFL